MRKKVVMAMLTAVLSMTSVLGMNGVDEVNAKQHHEKKEESYNKKTSIDIVATIPIGEDEIMNYTYSESGDVSGPRDFEILQDGSFLILSSDGKELLKCKGDKITQIDIKNYEFEAIYFSDMEEVILKNADGAYIMLDKKNELTLVKKGSFDILKKVNREVLKIINYEDKYFDIVRSDEEGNFYTNEYRYDGEKSYFMFERYICKYDSQGTEIEYAIYDIENCVTEIEYPVNVDKYGNIYLMRCYEGYITISKVKLGNDDESKLKERQEKYEAMIAEEAFSNMGIATISVEEPTYSRYQVFLRALSMSRTSWTVSAANKNTALVSGSVTLPKYIKNATVGQSVLGIPYCYGGFYGIDTVGNYKKYIVACKENVVAGNINTSVAVSGTVGLDCSGFVSSALGFASKKHSSYFATYGTSINNIDDLKYMDVIYIPGHVMLYGGEKEYFDEEDNVTYKPYIYDASTDLGKVGERLIPNYINLEATTTKLRNPWND